MLCRTSYIVHTVYIFHAYIMHLTWNPHGVKTWIFYNFFKFLKACFNCLDLCQTKFVNPYFMLWFIAMRLQVVDNSWIPQNRPWMTSTLSTIALFQTSSALSYLAHSSGIAHPNFNTVISEQGRWCPLKGIHGARVCSYSLRRVEKAVRFFHQYGNSDPLHLHVCGPSWFQNAEFVWIWLKKTSCINQQWHVRSAQDGIALLYLVSSRLSFWIGERQWNVM